MNSLSIAKARIPDRAIEVLSVVVHNSDHGLISAHRFTSQSITG